MKESLLFLEGERQRSVCVRVSIFFFFSVVVAENTVSFFF